MQHKIKAVFRRSRHNKSLSSHSPRQSYEASSQKAGQFSTDEPVRDSLDDPKSRSRPGSSINHVRHTSDVTASISSNAHNGHVLSASTTEPTNGSIANDYKAHLPALAHPPQDMPVNGSKQLSKQHAAHAVDRNIQRSSIDGGRNKPLPEAPDPLDRVLERSREPSSSIMRSNGTYQESGQDWKAQQAALREGVVDLRDTVDVDKDTQIAAPVIHEVVKPHEHEIIQHEIYREIHNYSYHHRLQPVMHTEVLPPRHFIPNPEGEGLLEITAEELPSRTGQNRWWEIVQKQTPQTYEVQSQWRTEPEIIHGKPYMTEEGFERKETTIIYPPTLEDMSEYEGAVQPVHFDHKTGERWLGEVTTMLKFRDQHGHEKLATNGLKESLSDVSDSPSIKRKPVGIAI